MVAHESFNDAILPTDESRLLGCVYIDPAPASPADARVADDGPAAEVSWWVVEDAPPGIADAVLAFVPRWLADAWPFTTVTYPFGELA